MTSSGQVGSTWQQTRLAERQRRATNVIARSIFGDLNGSRTNDGKAANEVEVKIRLKSRSC